MSRVLAYKFLGTQKYLGFEGHESVVAFADWLAQQNATPGTADAGEASVSQEAEASQPRGLHRARAWLDEYATGLERMASLEEVGDAVLRSMWASKAREIRKWLADVLDARKKQS